MIEIITARPSAANDFAFYAGEWDVANRRRHAAGIWDEFPATCSVSMCVDDLVQLDHYDAPDFPGRGHVKAVTVRAYDAVADTWSIIWLSNYAEPDFVPMVGRWDGDTGLFLATVQDADGSPLDVRFVWTRDADDRARWEQAFSYDGGSTWDVNWTMDMTRRP
ncbi:hypothetical protein DSM104299_01873 [Baekduia alba]|uniref:hypothetical protein n=1 Tax=Baekduia alba TaxID=2997333 RepID=UPI0023413389|nr:hypothetical protein [Baekduia alba]WCB93167.1 hypothetical protein DSM104299_01873 [Baekduia alba]